MAKQPKKTAKKNAATQTGDNEDTMLEIARLQEQISLLTIENKVLREHTVRRSPIATRSTPRKTNINRELIEDGSKTVKGNSKGCSCKGNCGTKICGCVKKDKKCDHLCRCNHESCQNMMNEDGDGDKSPMNKSPNSFEGSGLFSPPVLNKKTNDSDDKYKPPSTTFNSSPNQELSSSDEENRDPMHQKKINYDTPSLKENLNAQRKGRLHKRLLMPPITTTTQRSKTSPKEKKETEKTKGVGNSENVESVAVILNIDDKTQIGKNEGNKNIVEKKQKEIADKPVSPDHSTLDETTDPNFDPTKPKHQLVRTPPRAYNASTTVAIPVNEESNLPLTPPISKFLEKKDLTPTEELEPVIDWNEHQAMLIPCDKCKRKFNPSRITKHIAVCKGV